MNDETVRATRELLPEEEEQLQGSRMSFGDHLEELRACLIKALLGVGLLTIVAFVFGRDVLGLIIRPLLVVQLANGLPPLLQVLSPTGAFSMYMKMSFLTGLIVAMPWVLHQLWTFVASGLYRHERRFVRQVIPTSLGLFALGVLFLYVLVLPIVLHFFIRFNESFGVSVVSPMGFEAVLFPSAAPSPPSEASRLAAGGPPARIPVLLHDPADPEPGDAWINTSTHRLVVQANEETWSTPLQSGASVSAMHSQFALDAYVSFVLTLALGFGLAFETPIVVFFLAWTGIVTAETMRSSRRYVILATVIIGALLPPPDIFSQLLLAIPMYLLFEVGLLAARFAEHRSPAVT